MPRDNGGIIGPVNTSFSGVWSLTEAQLRRSGNTWPNIYGAALAESASGADAILGGLTYDRAIAELLTGSDSISSALANIADPYFNLTTLLLSTTATNGQQNNTFLDSSTNNFTITRNPATGPNAPTQGTFSPFSQTGWGNYFDGTDDRLSVPDDAKYYVGSGDFTIECWAYNTAWDVDDNLLFEKGRFTVGKEMRAYMDATSVVCALNVSGSATGTYTTITATTTNSLNTWYHLAFVRSGNTLYIFRDGTLLTSGSVTGTVFNSTEVMAIGGAADGNNNIMMNGYISNFRIITGQAVATSTFTPPTSPLTTSSTGWTVSGSSVALTGTVGLLTCQSNRFIDTSASPLTITVGGGTPSVQAFSPFNPTSSWSAATNGGSGYFDGTGDQLTESSSALFSMGTGQFTIEFWVYRTASAFQTLFTSNSGSPAIQMFTNASNNAELWISASQISGNFGTLLPNSWNHVAVVRDGSSNMSAYVNGVRGYTAVRTDNLGNVGIRIGGRGGDYLSGYISGFRWVSGAALYSGTSFTVPTSPPTATPSSGTTVLLLNFTNSGIFDATAKNVLETVGTAQVSTTQAKFGTTSMYFDGTTTPEDLLSTPVLPYSRIGAGDYTLEMWIRPSRVNTLQALLTYGSTAFRIFLGGSNIWFLNSSTSIVQYNSVVTTPDQWYYLVLVRKGSSGTNCAIFLDGTRLSTGFTNTTDFNTGTPNIGGEGASNLYQGYMQDFRLTRFARYDPANSTITVPTAAFPVQ